MTGVRVLTHNIHKGFSIWNRFTLEKLKNEIRTTQADFVFLQEVVGFHLDHDFLKSQFEIIADTIWPHMAYGQNSVYFEGHHGNAILSKYPIEFYQNLDLSQSSLDKRGLLHVKVKVDDKNLHLFCIHLGLLQKYRDNQISIIAEYISKNTAPDEPIILAGDFNDWLRRASGTMYSSTGLVEVFDSLSLVAPKTFPSIFPVLNLDRIYFKNLTPVSAQSLRSDAWSKISDHLPLIANFYLK